MDNRKPGATFVSTQWEAYSLGYMGVKIRLGFLLLGMLFFVLLIFQLGPSRILALLLSIGWNFLIVCLIFSIYVLIRAAALFQCISNIERLSYWTILRIYTSSEAVKTLTFGGAILGDPFKALLLKRQGFPMEEAFAAVLTERLFHAFAAAVFSMIGLAFTVPHFATNTMLYFAAQIVLVLTAVFLVVSTIAVWFRLYLIGGLVEGIARLPWLRDRFKPDMGRVKRMEDLILVHLRERPARFSRIVGIELLAQCFLVLEFFWIVKTLGLTFPVLYPLMIEASCKFIRVGFFFIPWQVGASEGVFAIVFDALGLPAAAGFTLSIVRRLRSLFIAAVGLLSLWFSTKRDSSRSIPLNQGRA
jgi:uncharacterized protein (TIRG00374 family)